MQASSSAHTPPTPAAFLDASIPFNLPPRRSMKMLKDGSDFVWPDAAHSLFVKGLQAWKVLTIGSKRTRAPRGEGKTDFLVRYLANHGVERTKKQVASHLQVLRTEWRNLDNAVLLSLVDEVHTRSLSEPSLPPPAISADGDGTIRPVFEPSPDPADDRAGSTPSKVPVAPALFPAPLHHLQHHGGDDIYSARSHSLPEVPSRIQSSPDISAPWQVDSSIWHPPSASSSSSSPSAFYPPPSSTSYSATSHLSYSPDAFHNYEGARLMPPPRGLNSTFPDPQLDYYSPNPIPHLYGNHHRAAITLPPLQAGPSTAPSYMPSPSHPSLFAHQQQQHPPFPPPPLDDFGSTTSSPNTHAVNYDPRSPYSYTSSASASHFDNHPLHNSKHAPQPPPDHTEWSSSAFPHSSH